MTLGKCNFDLKIILNGVPQQRTTTEIINKPLNHYFEGFYISTRMFTGLLCTSFKIGLA